MVGSTWLLGTSVQTLIHTFGLHKKHIQLNLSLVALGTIVGTGMVYILHESMMEHPFVMRDLIYCCTAGPFFGLIYLGLATYYYRQQRLTEALRLAAIRKKQADEQLELNRYRLLNAQIQPHFIFNTLANLHALLRNDTTHAEQLLEYIIQYLENVVYHTRCTDVPLSDELQTVEAYLAIQRIRMPRLSYHVDVPQQMLDVRMPPLALLTVVENAIKHGIGKRPGPGRITIAGEIDGARCCLTTADDGIGLKHESFFHAQTRSPFEKRGIGLENVRKRLASLHNAHSSVTLHPNPSGGCIARITMPFDAPESGNGGAPHAQQNTANRQT